MVDDKKRIAIDIDCTITKKFKLDIWDTTYREMEKIYDNVEPDHKMIKIVNKFYDEGYRIYLFTSRNDAFERPTKKWLDKYGVKYHYFIMNKPYYDIIIDDKSITPEQIKILKC